MQMKAFSPLKNINYYDREERSLDRYGDHYF